MVSLRRDGLTGLRVLPADGEPYDIAFPEPVYSVGLDANPEYDTDSIRLHYTSLVTPDSVYDYDLATRELVLRKQKPVLGGYDPADYEQHREWATAPDGTRVPISIVVPRAAPRATAPPRPSSMDTARTRPAWTRGSPSPDCPFWTVASSSPWRTSAAAARWAGAGTRTASCWPRRTRSPTSSPAPSTWSRRAGPRRTGWSPGAARPAACSWARWPTSRPRRSPASWPQVPFVDVLTTILDPSLPLTVTEWEEWGNPLESAEVYAYIKSYAPYENVAAGAYPPILAMGSLNDTRVLYHEPAKWVARLRAVAPEADVLLKTEMGAGHGGPSGRYDAWREEAFVLAWILDRVGASPRSGLSAQSEGPVSAVRAAARTAGSRLPPLTTATTGPSATAKRSRSSSRAVQPGGRGDGAARLGDQPDRRGPDCPQWTGSRPR